MTKPLSLNIDVLTDTEGASIVLCIPAPTLVKWRSTGENNIPYVKIGKSVKYRTADLKNYIERHTVK